MASGQAIQPTDWRFSRHVAEVSQESGCRFASVQFPVVGATGYESGDDPMRKLLFAGAMLASFAAIQSAGAADLALKAPPPPPIVDEWTGWYIGLNLGGSWGRSSTYYTGAGVGFAPFTSSQHMDGVLGGAQIGYNWQFNRSWVVGVEADFQGTGQRGSATFPPITTTIVGAAVTTVTTTGTLTQKMPWFGTVRGRLGVEPSEHWLLYVTGGLAYAQIRSTAAISAIAMSPGGTATAALSSSVNNDRDGWTVGVGSEWMFAHQWSAKVEYLYMDYGHLNDGFLGVGGIATLGINSHVTDNVLRAGVNYHFH
jgi:outer membrane immunogenic protein